MYVSIENSLFHRRKNMIHNCIWWMISNGSKSYWQKGKIKNIKNYMKELDQSHCLISGSYCYNCDFNIFFFLMIVFV